MAGGGTPRHGGDGEKGNDPSNPGPHNHTIRRLRYDAATSAQATVTRPAASNPARTSQIHPALVSCTPRGIPGDDTPPGDQDVTNWSRGAVGSSARTRHPAAPSRLARRGEASNLLGVATKPVTAAPDAPLRGEPVPRTVFSDTPARRNQLASLLSLGQDRPAPLAPVERALWFLT